ncbi:hypothetical protein [Streptomyces violaceusniger]|uniref:Uncharacterized protein n=1 Tax=Streptomyces violaceusniger (strain Tu 4113) TaxID=653045 RepID=G2PHQ2_STRV4|nr:hypothetical protein [Streptomyces violaceusniger]AEM88853.1 hypothetical protein Strvi_0077 [Streptomyces violaceusniger Tu 4113]
MCDAAPPPPPVDTPTALNRQIIAASERARRIAESAAESAKPSRALAAHAELSKLLELRLRIAGVLAPPGRPKKAPGRPADDEHQDHGDGGTHPGLYEVAASLRAALLELPAEQRAGAAAVLADAFPALTDTPLESTPLKLSVPEHLKPGRDAPPPWVRQQWER